MNKSFIDKDAVRKIDILRVSSDDIEGAIDIIQNKGVNALFLSSTFKYQLTHANWLSEVAHLVKELVIFPVSHEKFDFSIIKKCKNLEILRVSNYKSSHVDISENRLLTFLYVRDGFHFSGFENTHELVDFFIGKPNFEYLQTVFNINDFVHLKNTYISDCRTFMDLEFLANKKLDSLTLYGAKSIDCKQLADLSVSSLTLKKCKEAIDVEFLQKIDGLTDFRLIDSFTILSARDFLQFPSLNLLVVMGKSYFIDGDLTPMIGRLEYFSFDDKRHYNIKYEQFKKKEFDKIIGITHGTSNNKLTKIDAIQESMLEFIEGDDNADYTKNDVHFFGKLLGKFSKCLYDDISNEKAISEVKKLVLKLNTLNEKCDHSLIETDQREDTCQFIFDALERVGVDFDGDVTEEWREW